MIGADLPQLRQTRPNALALAATHPLLGAIGEVLVFPDRHLLLEPVDQGARGVIRRAAVRRGGRQTDGDVTDREGSDAVYDREVRVVLGGHLGGDLGEFFDGAGVRGICQALHLLAAIEIAYDAQEDVDAAGAVVADRGDHLLHLQGLFSDVNQPHCHGDEPTWGLGGNFERMNNTPGTPGDPGDNPFKGTPFEQIFNQLAGGAGAGAMGIDFGAMMGQFQAMMQPYDGPVNWALATDIARRTSAQNPDPSPTSADVNAVADAVRLADHWLDETTVLTSGVTTSAAWSRAEWIENTSTVWQGLVEPVAGSIVGAMSNSLPEEARAMAGPLMGMFGQAGGAMFGAQVGAALGELSSEVLTASDIGLPLGPEGRAALVTDNVRGFAEGLTGVAFDDVLLYLALREAAHQRLFAQVPWLRRHLLASVEDFGRGITFDLSGIDEAMRNINPADPTSLQQAMEGNLFEPKQSPAQEAALRQLETTLALVEGWVDEVVGLATEKRMPNASLLQEAIRRRRAAGGPAEETFAALVGLELRPRRLRDASTLWGSLRSRQGIEARDAVWAHPDLLPTAADLDDPLGFRDDMPEPITLSDAEFDTELSKLLDEESGKDE